MESVFCSRVEYWIRCSLGFIVLNLVLRVEYSFSKSRIVGLSVRIAEDNEEEISI